MTTTPRREHVLFTLVTLFYWTTMYIYVPILSPYMESRQFSLQIIGMILGSYGLTQIIVRFPLGLYSDQLNRRKPFLVLGMLTGALSCVLFLIPGGWIWPLLGRVVAGISASTWVAFTVMYASYYPASETTKAMSRISFINVSGQLIGMALSGWLTSAGWGVPFAVGIAFGLAGLLLSLFLREPKPSEERMPISTAMLGRVIRLPMLRRVSLLSILAHSVLFITMFGFTPLKATQLGATGFELTLVVIAFMVPHALASIISAGRIAPRFGIWPTLTTGFVSSALLTVTIAFTPSMGWLILTQMFNGFAIGMLLPLLLGLSIRDAEPSARATAMGFYQAVYSIGMFAGPFLAGFLNEYFGLNSGFWFGSIVAVAASGLTLYFGRSSKRELARSLSA